MLSRHHHRSGILPALVAALTILAGAAAAEPFRPTGDAEVLERLPTPGDASKRELRALRRTLQEDPDNLALATELARRYIAIGRRDFDPRYNGYAQAALEPWWTAEAPPVEVLVLRATLRQNRHEFAGALADLDAALAAEPRNGQAWLTRAVVLQVLGRHDEARQSCARLAPLAAAVVTATCLADVMGASGDAAGAAALLDRVLRESPEQPADVRMWSRTVLAELAIRLGEDAAAERNFRAALDSEPRDAYLCGAYADFLLDRGRAAEARDLLADDSRADPLLLRLALAEQAVNGADLPKLVQALSDRFAASRLRGDTVHLREEARFQLHLLGNPGEALQLARQNWAVQRESWDARVLLEAALAAGDRDAAGEAVAWLDESGLEDPALAALRQEFRGEQP
jgi:thioredoxin-like negative regulator of GroEL